MEYLKPAAIVGSIIYSVIGIVVMVIGFIVVDRMTPYDLWKELIQERNQPLATVVAAICLSIAIIVAAAIHGG